MNNEENENEAQMRQVIVHSRSIWSSLIGKLSRLIFAPDAEPLPEPPDPSSATFKVENEKYNRLLDRRQLLHDETSKTIRRVFYTLIGACVFCVITLAGSPDSQLLTPQATVKLPVLNYDIGFLPFLVVGPAILIALTIYLHIFVGQHRMLVVAPENRQPMLPNFTTWTARLVVLVIFYWMVPITIAVFAWKASPRFYYMPSLFLTTLGVAGGLFLLQVRRCPREWRPWGLPLLVGAFAIFFLQVIEIPNDRELNLFRADLSEKDLRGTILVRAILVESNLSGADLSGANLDFAYMRGANLTAANLSSADLPGTHLSGADLSGANLTEATLPDVDLRNANLTGADLTGADLRGAHLSGADLSGADLTEADLSGANLLMAKNVDQSALDKACGDERTRLPAALTVNPCPED